MSSCSNISQGATGNVLDKASWSSFLPDIIPFVSSPKEDFRRPPDNLIVHFVRLGAQAFLQDSGLLRDHFCFDLQCGVADVPLEIPDGRELLRVHRLAVSAEGVSACANHCIEASSHCYGCDGVDEYTVRGFTYDGMGTLHLPFMPMADVRNGFCATYSYTLDLSACAVPEALQGQQWRQAIRAHALRLLFGMDSMDWGDKAYVARYETDAAYWAAKARTVAANHGVTQRKRLSIRARHLFWS